jgi:hypothetical protein
MILVNINNKSKVRAVYIEERNNYNSVLFYLATNFGLYKERRYVIDRIAKLLKHLLGTILG